MKEIKLRQCHVCATYVSEYCGTCVAAFEHRRDAAAMSADERADELKGWGGIVEIPFSLIHKRIEELALRSVWTHELAYFDRLVQEVRESKPVTMGDIIAKVPAEKLIVATRTEAE